MCLTRWIFHPMKQSSDSVGFSLSPPGLDMNQPPGEGHNDIRNECGAVPERDDKSVARLPSADDSGRQSPTSVTYNIAFIDCETVAANEPTLDRFLEESGYVDPSLLAPPKEIIDRDDNHDLDLDLGDDETLNVALTDVDTPWMNSECSEMELLTACVNQVDPASRALYGAEEQMRVYKIDRTELHRRLNAEEALLQGDERGHADGGSMATTTHRKDLIWYYKDFSTRGPTLKVADDHPHYAIGHGYLRVPDSSPLGYRQIECLYTPSLPVTIISPDKVGRQFKCRGYTSVSNFDGVGCELRLHHCRRISEDVSIPLTLCRGLLFTDSLIPPANDSDRLAPMPRPALHAHKVARTVCGAPDSDDESTASTARVDNRTMPTFFPSTHVDQVESMGNVPVVETVSDEELDRSTSDAENRCLDCKQDHNWRAPDDGQTPQASTVDDAPVACSCTDSLSCSSKGDSYDSPDASCLCHQVAGNDGPTNLSLADKMLLFQRLGSQFDIPLDDMHLYADGVPQWSDKSPSICGHTDSHRDPSSLSRDDAEHATLRPDEDAPDVATLMMADDDSDAYLNPGDSFVMHHLSRDQLRILWHQRLGHMHSRRVSKMHAHADGVPKVPLASELDACPICVQAKLRRAARGKETSQRATTSGQGIGVDFGFMVQKSQDSKRFRRLQGLNGETCYCLIVDHYSGRLYGECFDSKAPPIDFLNRWLLHHGRKDDVADKYVRLDQGGDLGKSNAVVKLFENAGYAVELTATASSHQNGPVERPHQTIADALCTMLAGANLPPKFWPYAFHHFLKLYNVTPHGDSDKSPYEIETGEKPNLRYLRVFGCRVYALPRRPTNRRAEKVVADSRTGVFLGFSKTMKNILYFDLETETVKDAQHVAFDESMNDLKESDKPPNARLLDSVKRGDGPDIMDLDLPLPNLDVSLRPFNDISTFTLAIDFENENCPLGMEFRKCSRLQRAYASKFIKAPIGERLRSFRKGFEGAYVVSINGRPVFDVEDIDTELQQIYSSSHPPDTMPD